MYIVFRVLFIVFLTIQCLLTVELINRNNKIKKAEAKFYFFWWLLIFSKKGRKTLIEKLKEV